MKYLFGVLGVIILGILAVVLITSGPSTPPSSVPTGTKKVNLSEYINQNSTVRLTLDGRVTAKEKHRAIRISVSPGRRNIEVLKGYEFEVERSQPYDNQQAAYDVFVRALQNAGFANEKEKIIQKDEKGICPTGSRYIYELLKNSDSVVRLWSTSCSSKEGTFGGRPDLIRQLFREQIPDYDKLTADIQL